MRLASSMTNPSTLTLTTPPDESLRALERAVAARFHWRILTGGAHDRPRFIIEKQVRYNLLRGWDVYGLYRVTGRFEQTTDGETALIYTVSGQRATPLLQAGLFLGGFLVITLLLASLVLSPELAGNRIGLALLGVMVASMVVYAVVAVRGYRGHLAELTRFMEAYAQRVNNAPAA